MSITIRKNIDTLTDDEWNRFVVALNEFKASGAYNLITQHHATAMLTLTLLPGETGTSRNVAHRGPAFFPWHRQALRELELSLCAIQTQYFPNDAPVGIPYWRWNFDVANWRTAPIWNRIGGNGDPNNGYLINTGPFVGWTSTILKKDGTFRDRPGIVRRFTASGNMPSWGNTSNVTYDAAPWNEFSLSAASFRSFFEIKHNTVHTRVGGDMGPPTSPNDPVFWFHHCNVDRAWARWQAARGVTNFQPNTVDEFGNPTIDSPPGHHLNSILTELGSSLPPYDKTNGEMLDRLNFDLDETGSGITGAGFDYDTLVP
jgi:tyrosinase